MGMTKYTYAWKQAFNFDTKELGIFLISAVFSGFILSFRKWGTDAFDLTQGILNFIMFTVLFAVIYFVFIATQKYLAAYLGYECKYTLWLYGPLIGILITFMTYGFVPFLYLGSVYMKEIPRLRLGKLRQVVQIGDLRWVGLVGPLAVLILVVFLIQPLYFATESLFFKNAIIVSAAIMFFSSLPLPNTNGMNVVLKSRGFWIGYFVIGLVLLALILPLEFGSYVAAFILSVILVWLFAKLIQYHFEN